MTNKEISKKKIYLRTFGCQMNVRDSEVISGLLQKEGYEIADSPEKADIVIFNTCSVRQHAEDKVWSEVGRIVKLQRQPPKNWGRKREFGDSPQKAGTVNWKENLRDSPQKTGTVNWKENLRDSPQKAGTVPIIGIAGCMAQNYKDAIFKRSPQVDFVVGPGDIDKIPGILNALLPSKGQSLFNVTRRHLALSDGQVPRLLRGDSPLFMRKIWETDGKTRPEDIYHTGFYEDKNHCFVVISEGCSNYCSYCVVPYVRGELHNRKPKDILQEIGQAMDKGITKITLLCQNVNAYHYEGVNFVKLIELVNGVRGLKEFSFVTSHPRDTSTELFKAMADLGKLKKYLHLPVQSGSDRILGLMNRGYKRKFYLDLADNYRKIVKSGELTTDVIVGFPKESERDFQDTYELMQAVRFNAAYIFKYSPRPNTSALHYVDDVEKKEKERRHSLILELQKTISKDYRNNDA